MQIYQPKDGYCYNSDTLFLHHFAMPFLKKRYALLEVGAGCGVLGMLCARDLSLNLTMIEKNPKMAELCAHNLRINRICAELICADFLTFDFIKSKTNIFDVILSNPPFYHNGVIKSQNSDIFSARYAENLPFFDFVKKVNSLLKPEGEFIFCYDAKAIFSLFSTLYTFKIPPICVRFVHPKVEKSATLVLCRARKNSKSQCEIQPPLFTHLSKQKGQHFTQEVQAIYHHANTWSIKC
ncbi:tRNA1(Val) (adenine(37)-N6)-methyltransferase [Helicobacter turcicus]|uniref:Methyltransferase n=1 Tax=Helicobacter turcicus TaxID=2867412 RepID=A0ABS7JLQ5_9HELI|nr:methyltransferase [Helicobacter turcicus]MBX7490321.1 methyltransferase [Helicobacter turcicus]MBX7545100.1 methyltransferase [Helicobacter turcicus]